MSAKLSNTQQAVDRFIRLPEVMQITAMGKTTIYDHIRAGGFPKQRKIGRQIAVWKLSEVNVWVESFQQGGAA